ncbi:hypothetical protein JL107_01050 [Nakamurella flavida]|uniref:Ribosomally synthesized peptide with SipW-like signal peptide n=1 Tax=Nakamurella flavida TaxID=363630 RepID=A0A939C1I8_9ACTN|nr:SipW-dependent-type signal peptide-containing protein [Nakamurella flavida]MBM9475021.1 hypothetical protein [Nakamurella flavida]MDP9776590.1 putative ribosomally synthesized peptide with SipW-like signal peptide [Nakamurella flavida]
MSEELQQSVHQRPRRKGKVRAVLAGCAVLGIGATVTLAAWTDTEWVYGAGNGDGDPISTSTFEVQQNVFDGVGFTDRETAPGGALVFSPTATALTPGDTVTAPMQLQTTATSEAASITLAGAVLNGSEQPLFDTVTYGAYTGVSQADCDAQDFAAGDVLVPEGSALTVGSDPATPIVLAANAADTSDICFVITLPDDAPDTVQGQGIAPAWLFNADSVAPLLP